VITDADRRALATDVAPGRRVVDIEELTSPAAARAAPSPPAPDSPAWIMYTSGSTGRPKGVVQTHANALQFAATYIGGLGVGPADRISLLSSLGVNIGAHNLLAALLGAA